MRIPATFLTSFIAICILLSFATSVHADFGDQLAKLLAKDGVAGDQLGLSISFDNGVVAVGAWLDNDNGNHSGSAYLFDASTGAQLFKLLPKDGSQFEWFGYSIAINNGIAAVGALRDDDNGLNSGSAYLFDASTGVQLFKLLPNDGAEEDFFGYSIAIDNGIVAVGAQGDDDNGSDTGSAYLFDAASTPSCPWDLDNSGSVGTNDLLELFAKWGTDGSADFDGNGSVGTSDLLILFANWGPCE